ncbi:MAG: hypothetical protein WDM78_11875 [Puia sp.]
MLNMQLVYTWGPYYNGRLNSSDLKTAIRANTNISFTGEYNRNKFFGVGESKSYSNIDLYILQARLALNSTCAIDGVLSEKY